MRSCGQHGAGELPLAAIGHVDHLSPRETPNPAGAAGRRDGGRNGGPADHNGAPFQQSPQLALPRSGGLVSASRSINSRIWRSSSSRPIMSAGMRCALAGSSSLPSSKWARRGRRHCDGARLVRDGKRPRIGTGTSTAQGTGEPGELRRPTKNVPSFELNDFVGDYGGAHRPVAKVLGPYA